MSFVAFSDRIFSSLYVALHYTARSALLRTTYITLCYDLLTIIFSSLLERIFYLS